jgi:hypothetical protein
VAAPISSTPPCASGSAASAASPTPGSRLADRLPEPHQPHAIGDARQRRRSPRLCAFTSSANAGASRPVRGFGRARLLRRTCPTLPPDAASAGARTRSQRRDDGENEGAHYLRVITPLA